MLIEAAPMNDDLRQFERNLREANENHAVLKEIRDRLTWICLILAALLGIVWRMSGEWPF